MHERRPFWLYNRALVGSLGMLTVGVVTESITLDILGGGAVWVLGWVGLDRWCFNRPRTETAAASSQADTYIEPPPPTTDDPSGIADEAEDFLRRSADDQ
ncbi:MAG TPA: hypothetical protein VMR95_04530 [Candidatus Binatia bacterium]|nr:hypothetical protein [Candidatus Binatia bacterium]